MAVRSNVVTRTSRTRVTSRSGRRDRWRSTQAWSSPTGVSLSTVRQTAPGTRRGCGSPCHSAALVWLRTEPANRSTATADRAR